MEKLKNSVEKLMEIEVVDSNKKFCPIFHTTHEGYAIIKEEVEEAEYEIEFINIYLNNLWSEVKGNNIAPAVKKAEFLKRKAINLSAESIQVSAMCQKFIDSFEK